LTGQRGEDVLRKPSLKGRRAPEGSGEIDTAALRFDDLNQESVFIGITKLVESPEGIIPSFVWIKRTEKGADLNRKVFAPG